MVHLTSFSASKCVTLWPLGHTILFLSGLAETFFLQPLHFHLIFFFLRFSASFFRFSFLLFSRSSLFFSDLSARSSTSKSKSKSLEAAVHSASDDIVSSCALAGPSDL